MASMNVDKHSCRRIQWNDSNGKRRTLRLGQLDDRTAKRIHDKVERLIRVKEHGEVDDESSSWLTRVDDDLYAKLAKVGVVEPREAGQLGPWLDGYLMERKELKPASRIKLEQTKAKLIAFFPADMKLRSITRANASEWRASLVAQELSVATMKIHAGNAKAFFNEALRRRLVTENPFEHLSSGPTPSDTQEFISAETIEKVLAACPNVRWRLVVGLARYAGLRMPSETHVLTWDDVDFQRMRLRVRSSKTEGDAGKGLRFVPITANLLPILQEGLKARGDISEVVTIRGNGYLHNGLRRIIKAAKVTPWADGYQQLRHSFEKELVHVGGFHPITAAQRTGHSAQVSQRHYTQGVPDEVYERASLFKTATQNPTQNGRELGGNSAILRQNEKGPEFCNSGPFNRLHVDSSSCFMEIRGLEPLTFSMPSRRSPN